MQTHSNDFGGAEEFRKNLRCRTNGTLEKFEVRRSEPSCYPGQIRHSKKVGGNKGFRKNMTSEKTVTFEKFGGTQT